MNTAVEFTIAPDDNVKGTLIITHPFAFMRKAAPGQFFKVAHDTAFAHEVFQRGNDPDTGAYTTHIITQFGPDTAYNLLDKVFQAYVEGVCMAGVKCDAEVAYLDYGRIADVKEYGFPDGTYTMHFMVHCHVPPDDVEEVLDSIIQKSPSSGPFIVVRRKEPGPGYTLQGFKTTGESDDDQDDHHELDDEYGGYGLQEDDDPLDGLSGEDDPAGKLFVIPWYAHRHYYISW